MASKAAFDSIQISKRFKDEFKNISSLVISNYGDNVLHVTARGVRRPVPPVVYTLGCPVPVAPFKIESFGHGFDVDVQIDFDGGIGNAIIDSVLIKEECKI